MKVCGREIQVHGRIFRMARLANDKYEYLDDPEVLLEGIKTCGKRIDLFTFMQKLPDMQPKYSYPMEWDNVASLAITSYDDWFNNTIDSKVRSKVRKAEKKGVIVRETPFDEDLVRGIWKIYNESPMRQGKPFAHYGMDIDTVRKHAGSFPETSVFVGAYFENELIGFVKLICYENKKQADTLHVISMFQHRDKAPTNALIAQAIRSVADRGIPYLVYSNFAYGKKQKDSLSEFKEHNGFKHTPMPRYFIPLTPIGQAAFHMGLHRGVADLFPEPVMAKFRELRTAWYVRKFQSVSHAS